MTQTNKVDKRNTSKCSNKFSFIFASRLKTAREHQNLTQEEVAEKLDIVWQTYQHYESLSKTNVRVPNLETVDKLSKILDCDITYLTGENEENEFRKNTQHASETTGLDYDTIDKIETYSPEVKQLIDKLVLHTNKDNLLKLLNAILAYSLHSHHAHIKIDVPGADIFETNDIEGKLVNYSPANPLNDISKKMLKYSVTSSLDEILTDTYNDYIDDGNSLLWERLKKRGDYEKAAVKNAFEKRETTLDLTVEDIRLICGNCINNKNPTLDERYNQIDEEISHVYELYKESSKNSK